MRAVGEGAPRKGAVDDLDLLAAGVEDEPVLPDDRATAQGMMILLHSSAPGGGSGIGAGIVEALAEKGVAPAGSNIDEMEALWQQAKAGEGER